MTKLSIIILIALIASCNSETSDKEAKAETKKKQPNGENSSLNVDRHNDPSIIYDTLVFTDNMNGQLLNDKFISSQPELQFYSKFIVPKRTNELVVLNEKGVKTEIKYLGEIKDLKNKTAYHVVTRFRTIGIGQMLSPRGKSDVAFVNEARNKIIVYNLPMPQNLPKYISNNILFFEYDSTKAGISIFGGLPPLFCLPKIGCN